MVFKASKFRACKRLAACAATSVALVCAAPVFTLPAQAATTEQQVNGLPDFTQIIQEAEQSVVNIRTTETVSARRNAPGPGADPSDLFRWFFGPDFNPPGFGQPPQQRPQPRSERGAPERSVPRGIGSGFVISKDGYVLTNNHVIDNADGIFVTMFDGSEHKAEVVGSDARTDVALLKIDAKGLKPLTIGDSDDLKKGQWVLAIGSPFGLDSTVTAGIISAINRDTGDYLPFIQTDVAVNPGNSGGPLINLDGQVVGINSQIVSRSGGFMGISLAIPIDEVMRVVDQLKVHGKVTRGRIGVQITDVQEDVAKALGLDKPHGAMVSSVEPDGPAAKAGIKSGDVITSFDGHAIESMTDLPRIVGGTKPDTKATVKVWRKGKDVELKVTVGELKEPKQASSKAGSQQPPAQAEVDVLGLTVTESADADVPGVVVEQVESPATDVGIEPGDIILGINDLDVNNLKDYSKALKQLDGKKPVAVLVQRDDQSQWVIIKPE